MRSNQIDVSNKSQVSLYQIPYDFEITRINPSLYTGGENKKVHAMNAVPPQLNFNVSSM